MPVGCNINFTVHENSDDKIYVSAAFDIQADGFFSRDSMYEIPHSQGKINYHPSVPSLIRTGQNHFITKGSHRIVYTLDESLTEKQIEDTVKYMSESDPSASVVYEPVTNEIHFSYEVTHDQKEFRPPLWQYAPLSPKAVMTFSEGSDLLCVLRIDDTPNDWTVEYKDITDKATVENKGSLCYVVFSTDVSVDGKSLSANKAYKLTSDLIEVTVTENTKVIRLYR
jgi:hypothetical protein